MTARRHRTTAFLSALALSALALAGCSAGGSDSSSAGSAGSAAAPQSSRAGELGQQDRSAAGSAPKSVAKPGDGGTSVDPAALTPPGELLARQATVALQVKDLGQAVARIRSLSAANDGLVLAENVGTGGDVVPLEDRSKVTATTYAEITLSVPADRLDGVLADLGELGKVIRSSTSSEDVTSQVVDTQSRLATMRASVERVRALMDRATDLDQVVDLEAQLARRQADLEALESQLAALKNSVARSPVQVSLTTVPGVIAEDAGTGFLAGLGAGWKAFTSSVVVVLTVLGALLPFAFVLALVGIPLWLVLRHRRATAAPPPVPAE